MRMKIAAALALASVLSAGQAEENKGSAVEKAKAIEACDTLGDKGAAVYWLIRERIGYPLMVYDESDKANQITVKFYPPSGQECEGIATFTDACDLTLEYQCEAGEQ